MDVRGLTQPAVDALQSGGRLPPAVAAQLDGLVAPISSGVRSFTQGEIGGLVRSEAFADAWVAANRAAHGAVVAALRGETTAGVTVADGAVTLDLASFLATVKQQLLDQGFSPAARIPVVDAPFTLFQSDDIGTAQRACRLLDTVGFWLPGIVLALVVSGVYITPQHRRAAIVTGLAVTATMLIVAALLASVGHRYVDGPAAGPVAGRRRRDLRHGRPAPAGGSAVGRAGRAGPRDRRFLTGRSRTATAARAVANRGSALARRGLGRLGLPLDGLTTVIAPRAGMVRAVLVVLAVVALILPAYLSPSYVLWTVLGLLVALRRGNAGSAGTGRAG